MPEHVYVCVLRVTQEVRWCVWSAASDGSWQGSWAGVKGVRGRIVLVCIQRWSSSLTGSISRLKVRCDWAPDWHEQNDRLNTQNEGFRPGVYLQTVVIMAWQQVLLVLDVCLCQWRHYPCSKPASLQSLLARVWSSNSRSGYVQKFTFFWVTAHKCGWNILLILQYSIMMQDLLWNYTVSCNIKNSFSFWFVLSAHM